MNNNDHQEIDLGETHEKLNESPETAEPQPSYPTVMLSGGPALHQIPQTGRLSFKHKVVAKHMPHGHQKHHRIEVELQSVSKPKATRKHGNFQANDGKRMKKLLEDVPA